EEPDEREDQRPPGDAVLDDDGLVEHTGIARLRARRQVQGIDRHGVLYRDPLVEGTRPSSRGSRATARRSARARPLKQLSAIWCWLSPYKVSTCSVMPAFMAKAWNHSRTSSVSKVPILSRAKAVRKTRKGRPEMSSATRVSVSSMGRWTSA